MRQARIVTDADVDRVMKLATRLTDLAGDLREMFASHTDNTFTAVTEAKAEPAAAVPAAPKRRRRRRRARNADGTAPKRRRRGRTYPVQLDIPATEAPAAPAAEPTAAS